jgi:GNAT superfamily N-acetyltransferase
MPTSISLVVCTDMAVAVRLARPEDARSLFALVRLFPTPTPPDYEAFSASFRAKLPDPASYLTVADYQGLLVGYLSGDCHHTFYAAGKTAWVDEVFVLPEFRGQRIGTRLLEVFEHWAQQQNCVLVSLATAGARGFYERLGYTSKAGYYKKYMVCL